MASPISDPSFACVVIDSKHIKCFGKNKDGVFLQINDEDVIGRYGILETKPLNLGNFDSIIDLSVSMNPSSETALCAVLEVNQTNVIKCWGNSFRYNYSQLGTNQNIVLNHWNSTIQGDNIPTLPFFPPSNPRYVSLGDDFACTLLEDGTIYCTPTIYEADIQ